MQVLYCYVDPFVVNLKVMLSYHKFKKGIKAEINDVLRL